MQYLGALTGALYGGMLADDASLGGAIKGAAVGGLIGRYGGAGLKGFAHTGEHSFASRVLRGRRTLTRKFMEDYSFFVGRNRAVNPIRSAGVKKGR